MEDDAAPNIGKLWVNSVGQWRDRANCATTDPDLFFNPDGGDKEMREYFIRVRLAKQICSECVVMQQCLDYALAADEKYGIWGGLIPKERRETVCRIGDRERLTETRAA